MGEMVSTAESTAPLNVAVMIVGKKQLSNQLYCILLLSCRQQPLTEVVNSGQGEGVVVWTGLADVSKLAVDICWAS